MTSSASLSALSRIFRVLNVLAALMFLLSAALQWNDPDPLWWIVVYGAAGIACLLPRPARWFAAALVEAAALAWAATMAHVLRDLVFTDLFQSMKASNPTIEESRELLGLLIVAAWMIVIVVVDALAKRRGRRPPSGTSEAN